MEESLKPVKKLWELEIIRIDPSKPAPEDRIAYQQYLYSVEYHDGQYWVQLPWKMNKPHLPSNYNMAFGQMKALVTWLNKDPELLKIHDSIIAELDNDYIEKASEPDSSSDELHDLTIKGSVQL